MHEQDIRPAAGHFFQLPLGRIMQIIVEEMEHPLGRKMTLGRNPGYNPAPLIAPLPYPPGKFRLGGQEIPCDRGGPSVDLDVRGENAKSVIEKPFSRRSGQKPHA